MNKYIFLLWSVLPCSAAHAAESDDVSSWFDEHAAEPQRSAQLLLDLARNSTRMEQTQARYQASRSEARRLLSGLQPSLTLSANSQRSHTDGTLDQATSSSGVDLTLRQNIFRGGIDLLKHEIYAARSELADRNQTSDEALVVYATLKASLDYSGAAFKERLAGLAAKNAAALIDIAQRKTQRGLAGKIDILQAQARSAEADVGRVQAEAAVATIRAQMAASLGIDTNSPSFRATENGLRRAQLDVTGFKSAILPAAASEPQSLRIAQLELTTASLDAKLAQRERWLPEVNIFAQAAQTWPDRTLWARDEVAQDVTRRQTYGLEFSWTLWSGQDRIAQARDQLALKMSDDAYLKQQFAVTQLQARKRLESAQETARTYTKVIKANLELYRAEKALYEAGSSELLRVLEADKQHLLSVRAAAENAIAAALAQLDLWMSEAGIDTPKTL